MLILTRKSNEGIIIEPAPDLDPNTPISALFEQGPIDITVYRRGGGETQLIIRADKRFRVLRKELREP